MRDLIHPQALIVGLMLGLAFSPQSTHAQDQGTSFENLQVLPQDISERALNRVMLGNLRGLGLPRRQNEGCLFCHVGDMERPTDEWDFASDEKPTKEKARVMLAMVEAINEEHLSRLDDRVAPSFRVTCYTCHTGRTDPRPLPDVLLASYEEGGVEDVLATYRALRERYYGADAYDFRVDVLASVANRIAAVGSLDDGLAIAALNDEVYPEEPMARRAWVGLGLWRTLGEGGVQAVLTEFDQLRARESATVMSPAVLDNLGWGLYRSERQEEAVTVFRKNLDTFPDRYIPNESLADALWFMGDKETPIRMFEAWLERNPDHAMARRRLTNLRAGG